MLKLVVAGGDTPPVFELTEHSLDGVAFAVGLSIEGMGAFSGRIVGDDGSGAQFDEELAQAVAVIGRVGDADRRWRQGRDQGQGNTGVTELTGRDLEGDRATKAVCCSVDFRRTPTARAPYGLGFGPPFPPAAERCALTWELSSRSSAGGPPAAASARNTSAQTPLAAQRTKRL